MSDGNNYELLKERAEKLEAKAIVQNRERDEARAAVEGMLVMSGAAPTKSQVIAFIEAYRTFRTHYGATPKDSVTKALERAGIQRAPRGEG